MLADGLSQTRLIANNCTGNAEYEMICGTCSSLDVATPPNMKTSAPRIGNNRNQHIAYCTERVP